RRVWGMARGAVALQNGNVSQCTLDHLPFRKGSSFLPLLFAELRLKLHRVAMASAADGLSVPVEKTLVGGCVGLVAVQAAFLIEKRPVDPVLSQSLVHHRVVTTPAKLEARLLGLERGRRRGGFVALAAHLLFHGRMD